MLALSALGNLPRGNDTRQRFEIDTEGRPKSSPPTPCPPEPPPRFPPSTRRNRQRRIEAPQPIPVPVSDPSPTLTQPFECSAPGIYTATFCDTLNHCRSRSFECLGGPGIASIRTAVSFTSFSVTADHLKGNSFLWTSPAPCLPAAIPPDRWCDSVPRLSPGVCVKPSNCDVHWQAVMIASPNPTGISFTVNLPAEAVALGEQRVGVTFKIMEGTDPAGSGAVSPNLELGSGIFVLKPGESAAGDVSVPSMGQDKSRCTENVEACVRSKRTSPI